MRRALLLLLGVSAVTWLEYQVFPGHMYLQGETQFYLPMLERLDSPGFLSRDLVATHPNVTYTIYDEITLFLHRAIRLDFQTALAIQQILCRAAAITGALLLALSAGLSDLLALMLTALLNLGAVLSGPDVLLVEHEPIPRAFAIGLVLLAAGLISREKPLLAGLSGGLALVYDPAIAAPFWIVILLAAVADRQLRRLIRPALTVLIVFVLLLANLAQLQPGASESQALFGRIAEPFARLQQHRTSFVWVSLWASGEIWNYLAILICGIWATARSWPALNRAARWLFLALPLCGLLSVAASYLLLDRLRWSLVPHFQPARALLYTMAFSSLACGIAGVRAAKARNYWEACLWFIVVFAVPINGRILELLSFAGRQHVLQLGSALALAGGLVVLLGTLRETRWKALVLLVPMAAVLLIPRVSQADYPNSGEKSILGVADWAERTTWGSSMFLFPDAGRERYPGIFRATALRALWVDWKSGKLAPYFESFAVEWQQRWQQTMQSDFSPQGLQKMLSLPIDYYVLKRVHQLADIKPVFINREFVVYDARDLRDAASPLR